MNMYARLDAFNRKYRAHIDDGFDGVSIINSAILDFLEEFIPGLIESYPEFKFAQIKLKWGRVVAHTNLPTEINNEFEFILNKIYEETSSNIKS